MTFITLGGVELRYVNNKHVAAASQPAHQISHLAGSFLIVAMTLPPHNTIILRGGGLVSPPLGETL